MHYGPNGNRALTQEEQQAREEQDRLDDLEMQVIEHWKRQQAQGDSDRDS